MFRVPALAFAIDATPDRPLIYDLVSRVANAVVRVRYRLADHWSSPMATSLRHVVLTMQVVRFSLLAAALSVFGVAIASYKHPVPWTALLTSVAVACAGFQITNARRTFALNAPAAIRPWMVPLSWACYGTAAILAILGARALLHLSLAI